MAFNTDLHFLLSGATSITLGFNTHDPTHDVISKLSEVTALQRFHSKTSNHILGGTPMDTDFFHVYSVTHKEILNVDMPSVLAAQSLPVALKEDCTLVILQQEILDDPISLC